VKILRHNEATHRIDGIRSKCIIERARIVVHNRLFGFLWPVNQLPAACLKVN
jgi:hypothetical protein